MIRNRKLCHGSAPILLAICLLTGCLGYAAPQLQAVPPDQLASVQNGSNAVALARVDCAAPTGGNIFTTRQLPHVPMELVLGDSDSAGEPRWSDSRRDFHALSKDSSEQGWIALIKPPGYYYLHFVDLGLGAGANFNGWPPGREPIVVDGTLSDPLKRQPTLRIELPPNAPLLYVGSFHVDCHTAEYRGSHIVRSTTAAVEDETEAAVAVARRELPSLPLPVTRLAEQQTGPILIGVPPADSK